MKVLFTTALFLVLARLASAQWVNIGPGAESFSSISFADTQFGWVCGTNGSVYSTANGGQTWDELPDFYNIKPHNNMRAIVTPSRQQVALLWELPSATQPAVIYYSQYGFVGFVPATNGFGDFNNLNFRQSTLGFVTGNAGTLRLSRDQGTSWLALTSGTQNDLFAADSPDGTVAYLVGSKGTLRKGTGPTFTDWRALNTTTTARLTSVWFVDAQQGYIVGDEGTALRTSDGGTTWTPMPVGTQVDLNAVRFLNATTGFIAGSLGTLLLTTDGGKSWRSEPTNTFETLNGLYATPDGNSIWAAGGGGVVLKRGAVIITPLASQSSSSTPQWEAYPNPFTTTLTLSLPRKQNDIEVRLLDPTGRLVMHQTVASPASQNPYSMSLPENLATGVYVLQVLTPNQPTETRRLVHLSPGN